MDNTISFLKSIYHKDSIYSSIEEWKEYIEVLSILENEISYILNLKECDLHLKQEFVNYVLDKTSSIEISS